MCKWLQCRGERRHLAVGHFEKRLDILGVHEAEPSLVFKHACEHDLGVESHEQLAAHDNGERLDEHDTQGQQQLHGVGGGVIKLRKNGAIAHSRIWTQVGGKFILKQPW